MKTKCYKHSMRDIDSLYSPDHPDQDRCTGSRMTSVNTNANKNIDNNNKYTLELEFLVDRRVHGQQEMIISTHTSYRFHSKSLLRQIASIWLTLAKEVSLELRLTNATLLTTVTVVEWFITRLTTVSYITV